MYFSFLLECRLLPDSLLKLDSIFSNCLFIVVIFSKNFDNILDEVSNLYNGPDKLIEIYLSPFGFEI